MTKLKIKISDSRFQIPNFKKLFLVFFILFFSFSTNAQCAMCRASLEGEGNVAKAKAVNDGIVYLMVIPYILAGIVAIIIYKMYNSRKRI